MQSYESTSRRGFVKLFTFGVVTSLVSGRSLHELIVGEAQAAGSGAGLLTLKLSSFPALQSANGSIRIALNPFTLNGPSGPFYPILVNRTTGNQFYALQARCTHEGCVISPGGAPCPCHSTIYGPDGSVLASGFTNIPLTSYPITYDNNDRLTIEVPGLGYAVTGSPVETNPGPRFRLTFPSQAGLTYEIRFRENSEGGDSAVTFASTQNGNANLPSIGGTGSNVTVYVPRTTAKGFYTVNVIVTPG